MNAETLAKSPPMSKWSPLATKKNGMKMPRVTASSLYSWRSSLAEVMPRTSGATKAITATITKLVYGSTSRLSQPQTAALLE